MVMVNLGHRVEGVGCDDGGGCGIARPHGDRRRRGDLGKTCFGLKRCKKKKENENQKQGTGASFSFPFLHEIRIIQYLASGAFDLYLV